MFVIVVYSWHQPLLKLDVSRDRFSYFRSGGGGVDKYLGCCCLLWPGRGGNARKGQGKSLTNFFLGLHGEI
jgi:hypothetical protein